MREKLGATISVIGMVIGIIYLAKSITRYEVDLTGVIISSLIIAITLIIFFISAYFLKNRELHEQILDELIRLNDNKENETPKESSIDTIAKQILRGEIPPKE